MNEVERLQNTHAEPGAYAAAYLRHVGELLGRLDSGQIASFIETLLDARARGACVFFFGNGGSAATASHFANDLAVGTRSWQKPFRVLSIADNVAVMTAIANDYDYEQIFVKQLEVLARPGDVAVAISASGNSSNILVAVRWAHKHGVRTVGLTGFDGGALLKAVDVSVHVPTAHGEYGPVEDAHMVLDHLVASFLAAAVRSETSK